MTTFALITGGVLAVLLLALHSTYNKRRESAFPVAELEKFKETEAN